MAGKEAHGFVIHYVNPKALFYFMS